MVEQVLDMQGIEKGEYFIKSSFDDQLQEMKSRMDSLEEKMNVQLRKASDDLNLDRGSSIKLDYVSHIGFHFRVSLRDEAALRKSNKYRILHTIKGSARFTNDKLGDLNEKFTETKEAYEKQQESIVSEVIRVAGKINITVVNN